MSKPIFPSRNLINFFVFYVSVLGLLTVLVFTTGVAFSQNYRSTNRSNGLDLVELSKAKASCCGNRTEAGKFAPLNSPEYETYKLTAIYYTLRDNLTATLMLNNKGAEPILATPTFYSMAGAPLHLAPIMVPAASYIDVDMRQLLAGAGDDFNEGSMKIAYDGGNMQLGAQVKLVDAEKGLIWAEQFVYTNKFTSNRLENVWWLPYENSDTSVVVSNTTSSSVTLSLTIDGTSPHQSAPTQITLNPWQTRVLDIMDDIVGHHGGHIHDTGGISITHTGNPGAVLARMFISKPNKGYSAVASFIDSESTASQKWNGNGLRFKNLNGNDLDPVLVARNNGSQTSHVQGRIIYTKPNGNVKTISIPQFNVGAGSTKLVDLDNLIEDANVPNSVGYGGIELDYDTPKGSIITSLQSVSQNGDHVFQVPMFDPQNIPSGAAGFPWKADGDFRTIVYVKNESVNTQKFVTHLVYEGGQYSLGEREIKPGQTIAVDFRELRDAQTPDGLRRVIPTNVDKGQIAWSMRGGQNKSLSVRSEQISVSGGVASTYACFNNCCPNRVIDGWIDPVSINDVVGGNLFLQGTQVEENCYQTQFYSAIQNITWSSSNTGVETVDSGGYAEAVGAGTTSIFASWDRVWYLYGPDVYCDPIYYPENSEVPVTVVGVQKIQYKVNGVWTDVSGALGPFCNGTSVDFRAVPTSGSFPSGQPTWGGDASGTGTEKTVTFSTAGSRTVSATSGNTVSVTINAAAANANINITWASPAETTDTATGNQHTTPKTFVPEYTACADPAANIWKLRAKKVDGGTTIDYHTGGYRNPSTSPPTSQAEAIDANTVMNDYYLHGRGTWHTLAASQAHEHHHNSEWTCTGDHYWPPTETAIETLTASYTTYTTEAAAITQMKTGSSGADAKMTAFRSADDTYYLTLSDLFGSRPYAAGQLILNGEITTIVGLAATNSWTGVPGVAATPSAANPCYQTFQAYP